MEKSSSRKHTACAILDKAARRLATEGEAGKRTAQSHQRLTMMQAFEIHDIMWIEGRMSKSSFVRQ